MSCPVEPLLICKDDFKCIGKIAKTCDWEELCIYIREQQNLSLLPKIGHCLYDLLIRYEQGWCVSGTYEGQDIVKHLFCGGRYVACDGTTKVHFGLMRSLVHWSYGAYILEHGIQDTPFGAVQKLNQDSVPADPSILKNRNITHRSNAEHYFNLTLDYLCTVKDCDPIAACNICGCIKDCSCSHCKGLGKGHTQQRRGIAFNNVSREY